MSFLKANIKLKISRHMTKIEQMKERDVMNQLLL
jgi:hypothetical protein